MPLYQSPVNIAYTPVISGSGTAGAGTYITQVGGYSLNGSVCFFWFNLGISAHTGTGNYQISLPFTSSAVTSGRWGVTIGYIDGMTSPALTTVTALIQASSAVITLQSATVAGGAGAALAIDAVNAIQGSGWYNIY